MRRNRRRMPFNEKMETKKIITISLIVFIIAIITFIITIISYNKYINKTTEIAKNKNNIMNLSNINSNEEILKTSSNFGKTINEVEQDSENNKEEVNKIAVNTSNLIKENEEKQEIENNENGQNQNVSTSTNIKKEEKLEDPTFIKPVDGIITKQYSKDTLIYSNTLQEWITHNGIDIEAPKTTLVKASSDGTIKKIKNDPRYGLTIVIEHNNGYESIYSNLLTAEFIKEGEKVKQGQTIATVGNSATFEISDNPHLHFEITKDSNYLDPEIYI